MTPTPAEGPKTLYRVTCSGFNQPFYVLAPDPTSAYVLLRADLDKRDYGFYSDRELKSVEHVATENAIGAAVRLVTK